MKAKAKPGREAKKPRVRRGSVGCPRAHFHRVGTFCKACETLIR